MRLHSRCAERTALKDFLREHLKADVEPNFGDMGDAWYDRVAKNYWEDWRNYDGRWGLIERLGLSGRILDMAAGCGTFILYGLRQGFDVWGIEPETWKRQYFRAKVEFSRYPERWAAHLLNGVGESLSFDDGSFALVSTYQTLEHVRDVRQCLDEMLRLLRPGGTLYIRAPNYACFYEPHYRLPFLPVMNKRLAAIYVRLLGRPTRGLDTLNWTTERQVRRYLRQSRFRNSVMRVPRRTNWKGHLVNWPQKLVKTGRTERHMNLLVTRGPE